MSAARRLLRALVRPFKRLVRPLHLRHLDYLVKHSNSEIARMRALREWLTTAEQCEHRKQVQLSIRRQQLERAP